MEVIKCFHNLCKIYVWHLNKWFEHRILSTKHENAVQYENTICGRKISFNLCQSCSGSWNSWHEGAASRSRPRSTSPAGSATKLFTKMVFWNNVFPNYFFSKMIRIWLELLIEIRRWRDWGQSNLVVKQLQNIRT